MSHVHVKINFSKGIDSWNRCLSVHKRLQIRALNCSMTHSPGKIEYNCRYFIMTFRTQIHKKKFGKKMFS